MEKAADILLHIIRYALGTGGELVDLAGLSAVELKELIELSFRQGVDAISVDGYNALTLFSSQSADNLLETEELEDLKFEWFGSVLQAEEDYRNYETAIASLAKIFSSNGFKMMVLKGYGCSLNYPVSQHRPCGDIDIWMLGIHKDADAIIESKGIEIHYDNEHHSVFSFQGFTVENHHVIMDANSHKSNGYINQILEEEAARGAKAVDINGFTTYLPSARFNSIHLLRHMASDFATVRTTLWHVLDWSTFVSRNEVDWDFVHEVAHKAKMNKFVDAINGICVAYLGYPASLFPIENNDIALRDRVLNEILTCMDAVDAPEGEMTFFEKVRYGIHKTSRMLKNRWKYKIVYDESLLDAFIWKARNRW